MKYDWYRRSNDAILQGSLTNSKRPSCFVLGVFPTHVTKGLECYLWDSDGKKYIDYICALGTNLFGYANPHIVETIKRSCESGTLFSLSSTLEVEAAEKIKEILPFVGKVRFLKTGTEAAMAAVRIAMAHTGRHKVLSHGFHGWSDHFISLSPPALGVPKQAHIETLIDLNQITEDTACVIIEPIITDFSVGRIEYLNALKVRCQKMGALLIFDEIITGFRWPKLCFSNDSGIHPDIILLGKAIAGGLPLSIVATKPGIGDRSEWFVSSTFAGDTLALNVMMKSLELLRNTYRIEDLWASGTSFINDFNSLWPEKIKIDGYPSRGVFSGEQKIKALFFQEACEAGILFGPSFFYAFPHIDKKQLVINSIKDIFTRIKNNEVQLMGKMPESPFAQKMRET